MKKRLLAFIMVLAMVLTLAPAASAAAAEGEAFTSAGEFLFVSNHTKQMHSYGYSYDESWFDTSSCVYNQELARMSMRIAMATADMNKVADGKRSYGIDDLFTKLGFEFTDEVWTDEEGSADTVYYPLSGDNTVGYAFGKKTVHSPDGDYTLFAILPRSLLYIREWAGNFDIGSGTEHEGFAIAADFIANAAKEYINAQNCVGTVKVWTAGFSRGAAVANVLAQRLDAFADSGEINGLSRDGIYAYCFECPQTVTKSDPRYKAGSYDNIFNVISPTDFVTKLAPSKWGYTRYGIDLALPTPETSSSFRAYHSELVDNYARIAKAMGYSDSESLSVAEDSCGYFRTLLFGSQTAMLNTFIRQLADWVGAYRPGQAGAAHYTRWYQDNFMALGRSIGEGAEVMTYVKQVLQASPTFIPTHIPVLLEILLHITQVATAHYGERCLAWMDTIDSVSDFCSTGTRRLTLTGCADVSVYDDKGLVAQISGDEAQSVDGGSIVSYVDENGQKVLMLPTDGAYSLEIAPSGDGELSYVAENYDALSGDVSDVAESYRLEADRSDVITAQLPGEGADICVLEADGEVIAPEGALTPFVDVAQGEYYSEPVRWAYENGICKGTDKRHFDPDGTCTRANVVTFLWRAAGEPMPENPNNPFTDVDEGSYYYNAVLWAVENGITSGYDDGTFRPNASCTRAHVVTFLWRYEGKPAASGEVNFTDLAGLNADFTAAIKWAATTGVTSGYDDGTFRPNASCTRAHVVTFLYRDIA